MNQLKRHGVKALQFQKVNGMWRKPKVSSRNAARLRNLALEEGTFGSFDAATGTYASAMTRAHPSLSHAEAQGAVIGVNPRSRPSPPHPAITVRRDVCVRWS